MPAPKSLQDFANTPTRVVVFLFVALALIALMGVAITTRNVAKKEASNPNSVPQEIVTLSPHTLVYGSWSNSSSVITAYDLSTGREGVIASLPLDIKHISVVSSDDLVYISEVDTRDHGASISQYNLTAKLAQPIYRASEGYLIDDYAISPNGQYLAVWEVQVDPESGTLLNGKSKVVTVRVNSPTSNVLYEETATETNPVRYPRAILDDGTVFMDKFLPNSGAGWAYGMSVSNFIGTEKEDIASMQNGTYSTQPILSPDGKYLVFGGFDGSGGSTEINGFRKAMVTTNTVELLNTSTRTRSKLTNLPSNRLYSQISWIDADNLSFNAQAATAENSGMFIYNIKSNTLTLSTQSTEEVLPIQQLSQTVSLLGTPNTSPSSVGNLGSTYAPPFTSFYVKDSQSNTTTQLQTSNQLMQLIAVLPSTSFSSFQTIVRDSSSGNKKLQLSQFNIKSEIAPTRSVQQSDPIPTPKSSTPRQTPPNSREQGKPKCRDLAKEQAATQCAGLSGTQATLCSARIFNNLLYGGTYQCYDSPLYLYGTTGKNIKVSILTPVSETNPQQDGTLHVLLENDGMMSVQGQSYDSIDFNYSPAIKRVSPPTYGSVVPSVELTKTINSYAQKLGLNEKETADLVDYGKSVATGKYVFISFFDHETSHAILPITFDPKPDVYRNIVFYFKNLESPLSYSPQEPLFDKIQRKGFTAVEISGIAE